MDIIYIYIYEYIYIIYKVPLWKVPRGVAQERTNARIKYLRTYLFRTNYLLRTNCTHPSCKEHTHIFLRKDYIDSTVSENTVGSF